LSGKITIPPSKSHTIRGVIFGTLADGVSTLKNPLEAQDTRSCVACCTLLGAKITRGKTWKIHGMDGEITIPEEPLFVGNSGTTLGNLLAVSCLGDKAVTLDGDESIRHRPFMSLVDALSSLGATVSSRDNSGMCPITVKGPLKGGEATVDGITSIYTTPLLVAGPLLDASTVITLTPPINEKGYIEMTMSWLDALGCPYNNEEFKRITIEGGQRYREFTRTIPGDASSAAFPLCAAVVTSSEITVHGLDLNDPQGDKAIITYLKRMGAEIEERNDAIIIHPSTLTGTTIDLTDTPDLLPILCVVGCVAEGTTVLKNIQVTRMKETDRVTVMIEELSKMGGKITEKGNELQIKKSSLTGAQVQGYNDHRVVMALTVAGMAAQGTTVVDSAESASVTYPSFVESMKQLGAEIQKVP
jgi:3-phosphoshikimate 1-carboxyvinyltransferase